MGYGRFSAGLVGLGWDSGWFRMGLALVRGGLRLG